MPHATVVFSFRRPTAVALALLAVLAFPSESRAQLGGLVRKAADAAARKAGDESGLNAALEGENVTYTDVVLELTPERVDKLIAGFNAGKAKLAGRPALVNKRDAAADRLSTLIDRSGKDIDALRDRRNQVENCRSEAFGEIEDTKTDALPARVMSDPALMQKMQDLAMRLGEAQMKGDTATLAKLNREIKALSAPTAADSAAVTTKCGPVPPPSPAELQIKALQDEVTSLDQQIRSLEESAAQAATSASGMNAKQYPVARERVEMWLSRLKSNSKQSGMSGNELKALYDRRADIEKAM